MIFPCLALSILSLFSSFLNSSVRLLFYPATRLFSYPAIQ